MKNLLFPLFLLLVPGVCFTQSQKGYNVDVTIEGLPDSTVFLAYHFGEKQFIKDTIKLDHSGQGQFKGKEALPQGIYMIVLPGRRYFEVLISDDQFFSLRCSYTDYFGTLRFSGSDENTAFMDYQKKWTSMQQKASDLSKRAQNNRQNSDSLRILTAEHKSLEIRMKSYLREVIESNNGNLLSVLVKAILPPETPVFNVPAVISNPDSVRWVLNYNYNKDHFFDYIDFSDERLLRTPILYGKLNTFFTSVLIQAPDSINREIDRLMKKCEVNRNVFQYVSVFLFNHFRESEVMGHDAVMVKIADDIYLSGKADWVSNEFREDLKKQVERIRPNLIGKKGQNLVMDSFSGIFVSLYDIQKDFTILYFWEPDCGHCKESTPKLKAYYEKAKRENIEVFAVCTHSDREKWTKYIEENKITWINGWDPQRSSRFDYFYNVQSTPMIYILDRKKTIIAKKLSVENIGPFIENYRKYIRQN